MNLYQRLFKRRRANSSPPAPAPFPAAAGNSLLLSFAVLNTDQRLASVMATADSGDPQYFELLQHAILQDPDMHVKFAALKRIHLFAAHPGLVPLLVSMQANKAGDTLEPYFSMALLRAGLISQADFEQKMNGIE